MFNNIVLIGFMGSGKTTLGRYIAQEKGMRFIDTDELIESKEGTSINQIFADKGEGYFRNLETDVIRELVSSESNCVISVGGGLPVREINRELIRKLGICVYLRTDRDELVRRLKGDRNRPLLAGGELENKIDTLMAQRKSIYEETAHITVDTDRLSKKAMTEKIVESMEE